MPRVSHIGLADPPAPGVRGCGDESGTDWRRHDLQPKPQQTARGDSSRLVGHAGIERFRAGARLRACTGDVDLRLNDEGQEPLCPVKSLVHLRIIAVVISDDCLSQAPRLWVRSKPFAPREINLSLLGRSLETCFSNRPASGYRSAACPDGFMGRLRVLPRSTSEVRRQRGTHPADVDRGGDGTSSNRHRRSRGKQACPRPRPASRP